MPDVGAGMRASSDATVPNRGSPAFHSAAARSTSPRWRATKFHDMRIGSGNGSPPRSTTRAGASAASTDGVTALAQVGQHAGAHHLVAHRDGAVEDHERVLEPWIERHRRRPAGEGELGADERRVGAGGRARPRHLADEHRRHRVAQRDLRQLRVVLERRRPVAGGLGLRHPQLDAVHAGPTRGAGRLFLGVRHAVPRGHQVELAWADQLLAADAVAVQELALHQPRHGVQTHVGVRADQHRRGRRCRTEVVGEAPRAHRAARPAGQGPAHREAADLGLAGRKQLDLGRLGLTALGVEGGVLLGDGPTHGAASAGA